MAKSKIPEGLTFTGNVKSDYTLKLDGSKLSLFLQDLMDCDLEINIKKLKVEKTPNQVRYWFGTVVTHVIEFISQTEGIRHNRDTIHAFLMSSYGGMKIKEVTILGKTFSTLERASLADMSKEEACILIDTVINEFALKGLAIPSPGPTGTLSDY